MKIRHGDLEACRKGPLEWLKQRSAASAGPRMSYERIGVLAAYRLHKKKDIEDAVNYLAETGASYDLTNQKRLDAHEAQLRTYSEWIDTTMPIVIKAKINIRLDLVDGIFLAGEVSRLDADLETGGYRAVLLTNKKVDFQRELRGPLLQAAIAKRFDRDAKDIAIGTQRLDGSDIKLFTFSDSDLRKARNEADRIASQIAAAL